MRVGVRDGLSAVASSMRDEVDELMGRVNDQPGVAWGSGGPFNRDVGAVLGQLDRMPAKVDADLAELETPVPASFQYTVGPARNALLYLSEALKRRISEHMYREDYGPGYRELVDAHNRVLAMRDELSDEAIATNVFIPVVRDLGLT